MLTWVEHEKSFITSGPGYFLKPTKPVFLIVISLVDWFQSIKRKSNFNGSNTDGSNTDGSFTTAVSNSFLSPQETIPWLQIWEI